MNSAFATPRLWSFRLFAALWGVLLAPLVPAAADATDIAELLPADTLAYVGWARPFGPDDPDLRFARDVVQQVGAAQFEDEEIRPIAGIMAPALIAMQSPGGVALFDLMTDGGQPDIQLALVISAGEDSAKLADAVAELIEAVAPQEEIGQVTVEGTSMRTVHLPDSPLDVFWGADRGHFVAALGRTAAARMLVCLAGRGAGPVLAEAEEFSFARRKAGGGEGEWRFSAFADVRKLIAKGKSLAEVIAGPLPPMVDKVIEALGVNAIRSKYVHASRSGHGTVTRLFAHVEGERKGILRLWSQEPLSEDDLKIVPKDAYWAQVWNLDLGGLWSDVRGTIEEIDPNAVSAVDGVAAMAGGFLGFSPTDELLPALGDTWALCDAPGHGGLLGTGSVLVVEVRDADAVHGALTRVVELLGPMLQNKKVNLALRKTTHGGQTIHFVVIGGAPVPVAPAWAFADDRMVFGLFPQTVSVALRQVAPGGRRDSILDAPGVRAALQDVFPREIQSFGYTDAKYFARLLYPLGLLYSTAATSMLSVSGVEIDPTVYPVVADVLKDVEPAVGVSAADGDGISYAQVGSATSGMAVVAAAALLVSILLPSLARARELAKRAVSASNLKMIGVGMHIYANDHAEKFPDSLETLIEAGIVTPESLNSPRYKAGAVAYAYVSGQSETDDDRNVLAYERVGGDEGTNVLFLDGHVEWMRLESFKQSLLETYQRLGREDEMPAELRP